jgi:hypothetical protein
MPSAPSQPLRPGVKVTRPEQLRGRRLSVEWLKLLGATGVRWSARPSATGRGWEPAWDLRCRLWV